MPHRRIDPDIVRWSQAPETDRPLLVLMHGRGADEVDLQGLVPYLPQELVIASIRAPIAEGPGFSWYPMDAGPAGAPRDEDVDDAVQAVLEWLDVLPSVSSTGLLGFSQGGAMAIQLLRYRPRVFTYAVVLSGFVIAGEQPGDDELAEVRPPVFWGRGTLDPVISELRIEQTASWLPEHTALTSRTYSTGHSIIEPELADVSAFITSRL